MTKTIYPIKEALRILQEHECKIPVDLENANKLKREIEQIKISHQK